MIDQFKLEVIKNDKELYKKYISIFEDLNQLIELKIKLNKYIENNSLTSKGSNLTDDKLTMICLENYDLFFEFEQRHNIDRNKVKEFIDKYEIEINPILLKEFILEKII